MSTKNKKRVTNNNAVSEREYKAAADKSARDKTAGKRWRNDTASTGNHCRKKNDEKG